MLIYPVKGADSSGIHSAQRVYQCRHLPEPISAFREEDKIQGLGHEQGIKKVTKLHHSEGNADRRRSRDQDVIGTLESIAEDVMATTGFFHNGGVDSQDVKMQNGVATTNCIDCLDRTNAAQFVIGKRALGYQLHALGIISDTSIDYDTDAVNLFTHMYVTFRSG